MSFDSNTYGYNNNNDSLTDTELQDYLEQQQYDFQQQNGLHEQVSPGQSDGSSSSSSSSSNHTHNNNHKKKKPIANNNTSTGPCYFQQLSVEVITHIFARLDPASLATVAQVCRYWRYIATDDACWKSAFVSYFGSLPFKRLRKDSWKSEYILRTHLIRKWEKGRGTVMQFNPKIGSIRAVSVDLENAYMLAASTERGLAVKCNPATGSVDKHLLYSTDDGVPLRVNAVQVEGQRILWGFNPGYITMTTRPKSVVGRQLRVFADFHQGAVTALALPAFAPDIALSAGEDGAIKIWVVPTVSCARSFVGIVDTPTCLELTRDYRILAGYANGTVVIWDIRVDQLVKDFREQLRRRDMGDRTPPLAAAAATVETVRTTTNILESRRVIAPTTAETSTPVKAIKHDCESDVILVTHDGSHEISKYNMMTGERLGVYGGGHDVGTITCMEWDIAPPTETGSLQAAMKLRTKMAGATSSTTDNTPSSSYMVASKGGTSKSSSSQGIRLLVTGDTAGTVCIWDGDATSSINGRKIRPLRILHGHLAPISALFVDSFKVVSGSDDGWIRIWDPLTGSLINVLGNKIPKNAPVDRSDVSVMRVTNIHCDDYRGVATIGHQVKTWDFSPNKQMLNKRNLRRNNVRVGAGGDSRQLHYEIKQEWKESAEAIQQERQEREREAKALDKMTLGGLSDEEMLAYAMMLSQEQGAGYQDDGFGIEEESINSSSNSSSSNGNNNNNVPTTDYIDEDDEELMMAMIASLETASMGQNVSGSGGNTTTTTTTTSSSNSSTSLPEDLTEWPTVADGNENRKWQKSSTVVRSRNIWNDTQSRIINKKAAQHNNDEDENNDELQYVLRMSQKEF